MTNSSPAVGHPDAPTEQSVRVGFCADISRIFLRGLAADFDGANPGRVILGTQSSLRLRLSLLGEVICRPQFGGC